MSWTFALINNRLSEIYFDKKGQVIHMRGHCYVERKEFTTKKELADIDSDIKKYSFSYRNGCYRNKLDGRFFSEEIMMAVDTE